MDLWRSSGPSPCSEQAKLRLPRSILAIGFRFYLGIAGTRCNSVFSSPQMSYSEFSFKMESNYQEGPHSFPPNFPVSFFLRSEVRGICILRHEISQISDKILVLLQNHIFICFQVTAKCQFQAVIPSRADYNPFLLCETACHNSKQD